MNFSLIPAVGSTLVATGLFAGGMAVAVPASADPGPDSSGSTISDVLTALSDAGIPNVDPAEALALGQSVCPLLAERGQNSADIASTVADAIGEPLGVAPMFTGAAISAVCPNALDSLVKLAE